MGIKGLNTFLKKHTPSVFKQIQLSDYAYKKIAIDVSLYLCKFKAVAGDRWLTCFVKLVSCLRKNDIHCVFVYDNGSPPEKQAEKDERREAQAKTKQKIEAIELSLNKYLNENILEQILIDFHEKNKKTSPTRLLQKELSEEFNIDVVKNQLNKMKGNIFEVCENDFILTKELFDILDIPYVNATLEGEVTCADMCKRGLVDAVLSEDSDCIALGSTVFLSKIDITNETCVEVKIEDVLETLNFTYEQFLDMCIMFGTDFNKNIAKVGPETAFKLMKQWGSIEAVKENTKHDISILNHVRPRELFKEYEQHEIASIKYCGTPDLEYLISFVEEKNLNINLKKLMADFTENNIEFVYDDCKI